MNARRKMKVCAYSLLVVAMTLFCGGCIPVIQSITPNVVEQGDCCAFVELGGTGFQPPSEPGYVFFYIDGVKNGTPDITIEHADYNDTSAVLNLRISGSAVLGAHTIVVQTIYGFSDAGTFYVTCQGRGCPPPPTLSSVTAQPPGTPLVSGGPPVSFRFVGQNFFNQNAQAYVDTHLIVGAASPVVQVGGGLEYFDAQITAPPTELGGYRFAAAETTGGISNIKWLRVDASVPPPAPAPGAAPELRQITPTNVCKCGASVSIKLEGSGFGTHPNIIVDNPRLAYGTTWGTYQADPDKVLVYTTDVPDDLTETSVQVRVQNQDNNTISDFLILNLVNKDQSKPVVHPNYGSSVPLGGHGHWILDGDNLPNPPNGLIFTGVRGLSFGTPYWTILGLEVDVDADGNPPPPITGDEATNLTITTTAGESNPFAIRVYTP
jgi:hypothetical protein